MEKKKKKGINNPSTKQKPEKKSNAPKEKHGSSLKSNKTSSSRSNPETVSSRPKVFCEFCGAEIPPERLEILPDTTTCVRCSQTQPYSEAEVIGLAEGEEENRINFEDLEEDQEPDFPASYNDNW